MSWVANGTAFTSGAIDPIVKSCYGITMAQSEAATLASGFAINAHNANSIYQDNGKVYPASVALNFIIKV